MKNFKYRNATDLESALDILMEEKEKAYVAAGCTIVLPDIRTGRINDVTLVNISDIKALRYINLVGDEVVIGPLTTIKDLETSEIIKKHASALWHSSLSFADPTLRNSATIGGNVCSGSPAADTITALLALEAVVTIEKKGGSRDVPLNKFLKGKGKTVIAEDELLTKISVKKSDHSAFIKLGLRKAMSISAANIAVSCDYDGTKVTNVKVSAGCLGPFPDRCYEAEKALEGKEITQAVLDAMGEALVSHDINPHDGLRASAKYRRDVAPVLASRALKAACNCK